MLLLLSILACTPSFVPPQVAGPVGQSLCEVGHPRAVCAEGQVVKESHGPLSFKAKKDRWADLDVDYTVKDEPHTMRIRVYLKNVQPCRITVDVIADDGPHPLLLDNGIVGPIAGRAICRELTGR